MSLFSVTKNSLGGKQNLHESEIECVPPECDFLGDDSYFAEDEFGSGSIRGLQIKRPLEASPTFIVSKRRKLPETRSIVDLFPCEGPFSHKRTPMETPPSRFDLPEVGYKARAIVDLFPSEGPFSQKKRPMETPSSRTIVELFPIEGPFSFKNKPMETTSSRFPERIVYPRVSQFLQGDVVCRIPAMKSSIQTESIIIDLTED